MRLDFSTKKGFTAFLLLFFFGYFSVSCHPTQRLAYFQDIPDTVTAKYQAVSNFTSPVVQPDDIINVVIQTLDPNANQVLNQGNLPVLSGSTTGQTQSIVSGYLVDKEGQIRLPYIGNLSVKGKTTSQIRDTVVTRISYFFKDPVVNVRFANFKVTVLGEVKNPSSFVVPNEKPTVIDALGLAGDITIYGRKDNVLLLRDVDGKKQMTRLNLDDSKSISSPFFYLRPNDVVYVEPSSSRVQSTDAYRTRNIAIISSVLSVIAIIISRLVPR